MDALSIAARLRQCAAEVQPFTPNGLSEFFELASRHFARSEPDAPITFHPASDTSAASCLLRGTLFWPKKGKHVQRIVRGMPRIFPTSDYTTERFELFQEPPLARAVLEGEVIAEPKLYGATIRVFAQGGELYCATDAAFDGGNPLVGAGIDNSRALGIDYGGQAARILSQQYGKVERLARLGYVAVFVLQLPEFAPDQSVDHADMILVDVIDPDHVFVDRLEKERIAEDYGLTIVDLAAKLTAPSADILPFLRRCRALEHQAAQHGSAGFIVKGRLEDSSDQMFVKVEPAAERDRTREITSSDLSAITEEITEQFGSSVWSDELFVEGLMLEYLGTYHRTARWRVQEYLAEWQNARKIAGLA